MSNQQLTRNSLALHFAAVSYAEMLRLYLRDAEKGRDADNSHNALTALLPRIMNSGYACADEFLQEMQRQEAGENPKTEEG